jgi:hypothetical protein
MEKEYKRLVHTKTLRWALMEVELNTILIPIVWWIPSSRTSPFKIVFFFQVAHFSFFVPVCWLLCNEKKESIILLVFLYGFGAFLIHINIHFSVFFVPPSILPSFPLPPPPSSYLINIEIGKARERSESWDDDRPACRAESKLPGFAVELSNGWDDVLSLYKRFPSFPYRIVSPI